MAAAASAPEVKPSDEFAAWLTDALTANNASLDAASLVEYLTGVLTADAASGEDVDAQRESVRDIVVDFEVLAEAKTSPDTLAEEIVDAFNRLCVSQRLGGASATIAAAAPAAAASSSAASELSSAEAEALARAREMTVATPAKPAVDKQLILRAYANVSDSEEGENSVGDGGTGGGHQLATAATIDNRAAMQSDERLRRERMRLEHAQKVERDRTDRDRQKKAKETRKEAEKKRTQKQEKRK